MIIKKVIWVTSASDETLLGIIYQPCQHYGTIITYIATLHTISSQSIMGQQTGQLMVNGLVFCGRFGYSVY